VIPNVEVGFLVPEDEVQGLVHPHAGSNARNVRSQLGGEGRRKRLFAALVGILEFGEACIQDLHPPAYAERLS
jgi:hypothetical protein